MQKDSFAGSGLLALCLMAGFLACGCAPRERPPLTFDDQQALAANQQCRAEATQMNNEWRGDTSYFPWRAYYDMCMRRFEISDAEVRKLRLP
ncbi:hypothetical protein [Desulfovibrio sp.]|uniref:hypothetical protein n=1 Tax=Desulfovibrio sp. TaxID=885 RepID=UPI00263058E8|nr:hypothetical protein [Desulfovibrio sp.]